MHNDNSMGLNNVLYCHLYRAVDDTIHSQMECCDWPMIQVGSVVVFRQDKALIFKQLCCRTTLGGDIGDILFLIHWRNLTSKETHFSLRQKIVSLQTFSSECRFVLNVLLMSTTLLIAFKCILLRS
jgi:hypothetical protein